MTNTGGIVQPAITIPKGTPAARSRSARTAPSWPAGQNVGKIAARHGAHAAETCSPSAHNAFVTTAASGNAIAAPAATDAHAGHARGLQHRHVQAMIDMIKAQRTYQLTSKAIQTADQMMEIANGVKR